MSNRATQWDACSPPPRDEVRLQAPSFPILTFDETSLTPSLGYLFNNKWLYPCETLISILWKFERANALTGIVVARLLGPEIDLYEGVVPDRGSLDLHRLRDEFRLPREALRRAVPEQSGRRRFSGVFRYCRRCLGKGYHSVVHQFEDLSLCPAHHCGLESICRRCGREVSYRVNVQLLEAQYRCANCLVRLGSNVWSPANAEPMRPAHRKSFTRRYFKRCQR